MTLVSLNTKLVECGIFRKEKQLCTTLTITLESTSTRITPLLSVTSKILLDSILSAIFCMVTFVAVYIFLE